MVLDTNSKAIDLFLGANPALVPLPWTVEYTDETVPASIRQVAADGTLVAAGFLQVAPPPIGYRSVQSLTVLNSDTVAAVVGCYLHNINANTRRVIYQVTLQPGDQMQYIAGRGFIVVDSAGNVRGIMPLPLGAAKDSTLLTLDTDLLTRAKESGGNLDNLAQALQLHTAMLLRILMQLNALAQQSGASVIDYRQPI